MPAAGRAIADTARLNAHLGIATLLALLGFM
jgi:hypothetical protein